MTNFVKNYIKMPSSYAKYKFDDLDTLSIVTERSAVLPLVIETLMPSEQLTRILTFNQRLPLGTEKAKSELLITPILNELCERNAESFTYFSGYNFDVDKSLGLKGRCDYLLTKNFKAARIDAPLFCIVEAKNDDVDNENSLAQCIAEMYAAQLFNIKKNNSIPVMYGAVSTGFEWLFLTLEDKQVKIDLRRFYLNRLDELLGAIQIVIGKGMGK
jgi:hypothetical protein